MRKTENAEEILTRRVKRKELDQVVKLISDAFQKEIEITGLDVHRISRIIRFYSLVSGFLFLFDVFHVDFETILVAVSGNKVVGEYHLVPLGKKIWRIDSAAVDRQFRGRGIYRKLSEATYKYIIKRRGERIITSHWTSNVAASKITKERGYDVLEESFLMLSKTVQMPREARGDNISIRTVKRRDAEQIYEIAKRLDLKRVEVYKILPTDFQESFWSRVRNSISGVHQERWILEVEGRIVGYVSVVYTSREEAANINSFYILPSEDFSELTSALLGHVLNFLWMKNIKKVVISLNKEHQVTIEIFRRFGFEPVTSICEMTKEIVYSETPMHNTSTFIML